MNCRLRYTKFTKKKNRRCILNDTTFGLTDECEHHGGSDVGNEYDDQTGDYGQWDGSLRVVGLLPCCGDNVEPDESIEASCSPCQHLRRAHISRVAVAAGQKTVLPPEQPWQPERTQCLREGSQDRQTRTLCLRESSHGNEKEHGAFIWVAMATGPEHNAFLRVSMTTTHLLLHLQPLTPGQPYGRNPLCSLQLLVST